MKKTLILYLSILMCNLCGCSDSYNISSGQKIDFYSQVIKREKYGIYAIPIYALNENEVFFVVYDKHRNPISLHIIKNYGRNFSITSITSGGEYKSMSRSDLYEENNEICYKPHAGILKEVQKKYETYPTEIYAQETNQVRNLEDVVYCYKKDTELANNKFDDVLLHSDSEKALIDDIHKLFNTIPIYEKDRILFLSSMIFPKILFDKIESATKNKEVIKPNIADYPSVNKVKNVLKEQKIHLSPNSNEFLINQKASKSLKALHYSQIDGSCLVFEKNTDEKWSYISIVEPTWLSHVSGWVPSDALAREDTNYYKKCLNSDYYIQFNKSASPSLYNKMKDIVAQIDSTVENAAKQLIENFISKGEINIKIFSATIENNSTKENIFIKYTSNQGVYVYSSKDDTFNKIENNLR